MSLFPAIGDVVAMLGRLGVERVETSLRRRAEYSADASLYRVVPSVVVFPRHADEVSAIVEVARSLTVPVTARGAGTSIAGNAVGPGIVVDFSRHLTRIRQIDPDAATAIVEPGVVLDDLQRASAPHGLRFGPDPSSHSRCTVGGMIGNNACGSHALGYGRTADNIVELDVITGGGERLPASRGEDGCGSAVLEALHAAVAAHLGVIRTEFGLFPRQGSGYALEHLLPERGFDVAKAFAGSEGTWGLLRQATVRLVRAPRVTRLVVLGYPDMAVAADAVPAVLPFDPIALEGIDVRILDVVRGLRGAGAVPELPGGKGWLLAEFGGEDPAEVSGRATRALAGAEPEAGWLVHDPAAAAALWRIREDGAGFAARATEPPGASGWEDAAVPPERLGAYLREFEALMADRGLAGVPYGHFGDGCLHIRINFALRSGAGRAAFREFLTDAARLVAGYSGSMSGEHGDGRARGELLGLMYSPAAIDAFASIKAVFDPRNVCNPGIIVQSEQLDASLREAAIGPLRHRLGFEYRDDGGDFSSAVHRCTGIGKCRAGTGGTMCPSFRATRDEKDSTRGRARVLQELASGSLPRGWRSSEVSESLDLCLGCRACSSECPTGVDMARYKAEALHQRYRHRPRPPAHYSMGWLPRWARLAALAPNLANRLIAGNLAGLTKRLGGMDPRRDLPRLADQPFRRWMRRHSTSAGDPVMLWVDTFTEYFAPEVAIAAVGLLERAGYRVSTTPGRVCCGLTWISTGQLGTARKKLRTTVSVLNEVARRGIPIVALEPSCTAVLRRDAIELLGATPATRAVSRSVLTLAEFLGGIDGWTPPDLSATEAIVQPHCHHRAVLGIGPDRELLGRAGVKTQTLDGCCGLAGNFGAERGHFEISVAVAENDLLPAVRRHADAIVLADGFSCRTQVGQLTGRRALHLAELLAGSGTDRPS